MHRILLLFVDGLGLGGLDPAVNPIHAGHCPHLEALLQDHAVPVDAGMGVEGLPQSATGQAAMLTGRNTAKIVGRHVEGFPGRLLREIVREHNLFTRLADRGLTSTFANAYFVDEVSQVLAGRLQSVTTVATLAAFGTVRGREQLERNDAVYQDLTRQSLVARGYTGPIVSPAEAAEHLAAIAASHHLTLFEYFQTDRAGHGGDREWVVGVLAEFDAFLGRLLARCLETGLLLVLTSDHGNIEDLSTGLHTANPVPLAARGPGADALRARVRSITDVSPVILEFLTG